MRLKSIPILKRFLTPNTCSPSGMINRLGGLLPRYGLSVVLAVAASALLTASAVQAAITTAPDGTVTINDGSVLHYSSDYYMAPSESMTERVVVDGTGSAWTMDGSVSVGYRGTAYIDIKNGGSVSNVAGYIGGSNSNVSGGPGYVTVDGAGSKWTNSNELRVGAKKPGTLTITNGGSVSANNAIIGYESPGVVTVDGAGSTFTTGEIIVGQYSTGPNTGTLNIINGSTVTVTGQTYVRNGTINFGSNGGTLTTRQLNASTSQMTGTGTVNVRGWLGDLDLLYDANHGLTPTLATTWNGTGQNINIYFAPTSTAYSGGDLAVGYQNSGSLTIRDGLALASAHGYIGYNAGSTGTATVDGAGSTWALAGYLYVGASGTGTLTITNGGRVSSAAPCIADKAGSAGTVTVDGANSQWTNSGSLSIGNNGTGILNITNAGAVTNKSASIGYNAGSAGTVTVDNATWTNSGTLYVGKAGTGTLNILNGSTVTATGATTVGASGAINFGSNGGTLTTMALTASAFQMTGTGTINTSGLVGDDNLIFNATNGPQKVLTWKNPGQNITVNLNLSGTTDLGVGYLNSGSLTIREGYSLASAAGYLGYLSGSTGAATVDGAGSAWTLSNDLYVGNSGTGILTAINGGSVRSKNLYVGKTGMGTIRLTNGATVTSSGSTSIGNDTGSVGVVTVDGSTFAIGGTLTMGAGGGTTNSMNIINGGHVTSTAGKVNAGTITVSGEGSTWTNSGALSIYNGTVIVADGGRVSSSAGYVGYSSGNTGSAVVSGSGSRWTSSSTLYVGNNGTGKLSISDGGSVSASTVSINSLSTLTTDVGKGSSLTVGGGTGSIGNSGTIRLVAGAGAAAGTYTPMAYGTLSGNTPQALGGIWNDAAHTVTVADTALAFADRAMNIDLATAQRMLIVDPATAQVAGMSFLGATTSTPITVNASVMGAAVLSSLRGVLASDEKILSGWNFTTTGYTSGNPVYLSLFAGPDHSLSGLSLWHYDGSTWSAFTANDLAYDGTYASFTVTGFSGYALSGTAPVPIPAAVWLLGSGLAGLVGMRRRLFKK